MVTNFNNFEKINEDVFISSKVKLRDSVHDIVMSDLKPGEEMTCDELSEKLKEKYNIKIQYEILEHIIFIMWWKNNDFTIFREKDKKWLDVWHYRNTIERKKRIKESPLGKSRRKVKKEEDEKIRMKNFQNYNRTNYNTVNMLNKNKTNKNTNINDIDDDDMYDDNRWWGFY